MAMQVGIGQRRAQGVSLANSNLHVVCRPEDFVNPAQDSVIIRSGQRI